MIFYAQSTIIFASFISHELHFIYSNDIIKWQRWHKTKRKVTVYRHNTPESRVHDTYTICLYSFYRCIRDAVQRIHGFMLRCFWINENHLTRMEELSQHFATTDLNGVAKTFKITNGTAAHEIAIIK